MSRDRSINTLTDEQHRLVAAAEQDLERLLALEPSPEFAAKLRSRVRQEGQPARWRGGWPRLAPLAASVVVLAAAAVMLVSLLRDTAGSGAPVDGPASVRRDVSLPAPERGTSGPVTSHDASRGRVAGAGTAHRARTPRTAASPRVTSTTVEVERPGGQQLLIDPRRREAVDRLLAMVRAGITGLPVTAPETQDLTVPPMVVEQLEVPLLVSGGLN